MVELQDIFREYGAEYLEQHTLSVVQEKAFHAILSCRTSVLGAHVDRCDECGFEQISYNSCRNRHCPKCQTFAKEQWIEKQQATLLNTQYFHTVFTVPDDLHPLFYQNQKLLYSLLFKSASETVMELCADPKYLGATPGMTAVLHTWGQNLSYHPHLHCIITGGGLAGNNCWVSSRKKFFLPVKVLSRVFRGKFLFYLKKENLDFFGQTSRYEDPKCFVELIDALYKKDWIVYCKKPFGNPENVIAYLGRYTHRIAISNNRITAMDDGKISFRWRDYKDHNRMKTMALDAYEFIRRFLMHVLPSGFRKIRHFGLFASRDKSKRLTVCRWLTRTRSKFQEAIPVTEKLAALFGKDWNLCPCCGVGHLSRAPPTNI
ncbi:MAG: IS91 family transposase [Tannerellaceae bacterium]|nr:IS91 family transposase [Tannerellaceae bacterium]